jgi:AraC-like DNA-binding protein
LREAARLLAGSDLPLTQVGFVAGYSDAAHFARAFKAATAMRPIRISRRSGATPSRLASPCRCGTPSSSPELQSRCQ